MGHDYLISKTPSVDLVNHFLIVYLHDWHAEPLVNDDKLVMVIAPDGSQECYEIEPLCAALDECASTDDVHKVLTQSGLAL